MKVSEVQAGSEFPRTDEDTEITSKSGVNGLQKNKPFDFFFLMMSPNSQLAFVSAAISSVYLQTWINTHTHTHQPGQYLKASLKLEVSLKKLNA